MLDQTTEDWRPIVGFEGYYEVSSRGRVRSLPRLVPSGPGRARQVPQRILSIYRGDHYAKVRLNVNGVGATKNVHTLVAEAFLGPRPPGQEVCHCDGDRANNSASNLRYDTHSANQRDQVKHGTNPWSRRTHCNRGHEFTPENVRSRGPNESGRRCGICEDMRNKARWQRELASRREAS